MTKTKSIDQKAKGANLSAQKEPGSKQVRVKTLPNFGAFDSRNQAYCGGGGGGGRCKKKPSKGSHWFRFISQSRSFIAKGQRWESYRKTGKLTSKLTWECTGSR